MPTFSYRAYGDGRRAETGQVESASEAAAYETLRALGLTVVDLREGAPEARAWWQREITLGGGALTVAEQAALAEQMATLFRVHLPALELLEILSQGASRAETRLRLRRVARLVAEGMPLAAAFAQAGPQVAPVFLALLRTAEQTDAIADQLADLAFLLRLQDRLRRQIVTALVYPAILLAAAVGVMLVVSLTLAPALAPLYDGQGRAMPASLGFFLATGEVLTVWWPLVLAGLGLLPVAFLLWPAAERRRFALRLPVVGPILRDAALLVVIRSLALMLKAGRPFAEVLRGLAESEADGPYAAVLRAAAAALERGERAHPALAADARVPVVVREMFRIGEEANALVPVLGAVGETLQLRLEQATERMLRLLTPVLTLVVGGMIGVLVHSIMGAVLSVNDLAF